MKEIGNTDGLYFASNVGDIYKKYGTVLKKSNSHGYDVVRFTINKKRYVKSVHRIIASTFIDNYDNLPEVNHIDGNKKNNSVSNLEWCDRLHNVRHANVIGLCNYSKKISKNQVLQIKTMLGTMTNRNIARVFNVSEATVSEIKHGRTWKDV